MLPTMPPHSSSLLWSPSSSSPKTRIAMPARINNNNNNKMLSLRRKRALFCVFYVCLLMLVFFSGVHRNLTFDMLKENHKLLTSFVDEHAFLAPLLFVSLFSLTISMSIPSALVLTMASGLLFSQPYSTVYSIMSCTIGAMILYVAMKTLFGDFVREKCAHIVSQHLDPDFNDNLVFYLLFIRIVPGFPLFVANLLPAFIEIPFRTYLITTVVGIAPSQYVFTQLGTSLSALFASNEPFSWGAVMNRDAKIALVAMTLLSLAPIAFRFIKKNRQSQQQQQQMILPTTTTTTATTTTTTTTTTGRPSSPSFVGNTNTSSNTSSTMPWRWYALRASQLARNMLMSIIASSSSTSLSSVSPSSRRGGNYNYNYNYNNYNCSYAYNDDVKKSSAFASPLMMAAAHGNNNNNNFYLV